MKNYEEQDLCQSVYDLLPVQRWVRRPGLERKYSNENEREFPPGGT